jgi:hypothetical protein
MGEHISVDRAWLLIQEGSHVCDAETQHLERCRDCREFVESFVSLARYIGFSVHFSTQADHIEGERAA